MIPATCQTSDGCRVVTFDATPWFEAAAVEDVRELAACHWGSYAAERVAISLLDRDPALLELFRYVLYGFGEVRFSCQVDPAQARLWLRRQERESCPKGGSR